MAQSMAEVRIDGELYQIGQWNVDKSLEMLVWLTKTLGEGFAELSSMSGGGDDGILDKEISEVLGTALQALLPKLNEKEVRVKCREITSDILVNGAKVQYDLHFAGKIGLLFKVILEVLKVQYADFFDALSEKIPSVARAAAE